MEQNINQALQQNIDFENAKISLNKKGILKTIALSGGKYRVEIEIDGTIYSEEGEDSKIATIRLDKSI